MENVKIIELKHPIGKNELANLLNKALQANFPGKQILVRCISSADHNGKSQEELVDHIIKTGTDKYDPDKKMVGHEAYQKWQIDMFATPVKVSKNTNVFAEILDDFSIGAVEDRGYSVSIDTVIIYDSAQCKMVKNVYEEQTNSDAFVFRNSKNKKEAVIGIITIK